MARKRSKPTTESRAKSAQPTLNTSESLSEHDLQQVHLHLCHQFKAMAKMHKRLAKLDS
ncbi:hypothetical protein IWW45_009496, partial [Coemansia sp. RSA 485]